MLLTATERAVALVSGLDEAIPASMGVWTDVRVICVDDGTALREILEVLAPRSVAINFSQESPSADRLGHGAYLRLAEALKATLFFGRLMSSEHIALEPRAVKSPGEISRIKAAIAKTDEVFCHL